MSFLSHLHADILGSLATGRGARNNIGEAEAGLHKAYPRMPQISLPAALPLTMTLSDVIERRNSFEISTETISLSLSVCGTLLGAALSKHTGSNRRHYPSGGNLYPIETYMISSALDGLPPSVFHYDPTRHSLETLLVLRDPTAVNALVRNPNDLVFSTLIVFTSVWERSSAKYGDFTYLLALLEAGHMAQNILLAATALDRLARPFAGFYEQELNQLLDINPEEEQVVYAIAIA
jgi:SagB-type dehydrogenase family enzyme